MEMKSDDSEEPGPGDLIGRPIEDARTFFVVRYFICLHVFVVVYGGQYSGREILGQSSTPEWSICIVVHLVADDA